MCPSGLVLRSGRPRFKNFIQKILDWKKANLQQTFRSQQEVNGRWSDREEGNNPFQPKEKSFATDEVAKLGMEAAEYKGGGEVGHGVSGESHGEGGYGGPAVM